jgi:hypothetical protein
MEFVRRAGQETSPEAIDFIRFCYRRRRVGWPEIYDEMCAVAGRGLYRGWSHAELSDHGIRFSLFDLPGLAALVSRVIADEDGRQRAGRPAPPPATATGAGREETVEERAGDGSARLAVAPAAG